MWSTAATASSGAERVVRCPGGRLRRWSRRTTKDQASTAVGAELVPENPFPVDK